MISTKNRALVAGEPVEIPVQGESLAIAVATAPIDVEFFDKNRNPLGTAEGVEAGDTLGPGEHFRYIRVVSAVNQEIKVHGTAGGFTLSRIAGEVSVNGGTSLEAQPDKVLTAGVATLIRGANARKTIILRAAIANTGPVRVGGATIAAGAGFSLDPGASMALDFVGPVYGYTAAAGEKIEVMEVMQ